MTGRFLPCHPRGTLVGSAFTGSRWDTSGSDAARAAATMRPSTRMFLAAFRSRSWVTPHSVQVQDLTARGFIPELNRHPEHSRLEGNQALTLITVRWQRSAFSYQQIG